MALLKRNIWLIYYILLASTVLLLAVSSYKSWHDLEMTYRLRQSSLVEQWYGNLNSLLVQQETIMDVLGRRVASINDTVQMQKEFDRLMEMDPDLFAGFGLTWPNGEIAAVSSNLQDAKERRINLTQLEASRDSFLYSMMQNKMVIGRAYFLRENEALLPLRKAVRDDDGGLIAIMSGAFHMQTFAKIFNCDKSLPECAEVKVIRSRDRYLLLDTTTKSGEDFLSFPMEEREYQRFMSAIHLEEAETYADFSQTPVSYIRTANRDTEKMGMALYDDRYEYWLMLEVDRDRFLATVRNNLLLYLVAFIVANICMYILFRIISDAEERRHQELVYQANHDPLTGLPNRNNLHQLYERWKSPPDYPIAMQFIDMNNFKGVNDSFGHECGDRVLKEIARRIKNNIDENDLVFRLGGDEFVIISQFFNEKATMDSGRHLVATVTDTYLVEGRNFMLGASMGIALFPQNGRSLDQLLRAADISMYQAKRLRLPVCLFEDRMQDTYLRNIAIEHLLRSAVIKNEISMMYQPQVDNRGNFSGVECLVRWHNEAMGGMVPPDQFIPVAEQAGLMPDMGAFIIERSLADISVVQQELQCEFSVSINISVRQFLHEGFLSSLLLEVKRSGISHVLIMLEITESIFIEDMQQIIQIISAVHEKGIRISMDDFGTGYSSLSLLHKLPVDELKIDKTFVDHIIRDESARKMVQSIIAIGKNQDISLLAEGVENEEQAEMLRKFGCDAFQGYYYSRPLTIDGLRDYLQDKVVS